MTVTLMIRDELPGGNSYSEVPLELPTERITVRELIRERVYQEVQDYNRAQGDRVFRGLVQPTDAERVLNANRPHQNVTRSRFAESCFRKRNPTRKHLCHPKFLKIAKRVYSLPSLCN